MICWELKMKVVDFNGREYNFPPSGYVPDLDDTRKRSELHLEARAILKRLYPTQRVLEEIPLPGIRLFADFYVSHRNVIIEVHGRQHYEYVAHFHGSRAGRIQSIQRDNKKIEWCDLNNIPLIVLPYNDRENWEQTITDG